METLPVSKGEASADVRPVHGSPDHHIDSPIAEKRFDASRYAFFGRDVTHEIEIGGLDEEDYVEQEDVLEDDGEENSLGGRKGRGNSSSTSASDPGEVSELAYSFMQINISSSEGDTALAADLETARKHDCVKEATTLIQNFGPLPCNDLSRENQEAPVEHGGKKWWPNAEQNSSSEIEFVGSLGPSSLQTYQQEWQGGEPSSVQVVPPASLYPSIKHTQQGSPCLAPSGQLLGRGLSGPLPGQYGQPYLTVQARVASMTSSRVTSPSQYSSSGSVTPLAPPALCVAQSNIHHRSVTGSCPQQFHLHSSLLPPQVVLQYQIPHVPQPQGIPPSPYPHLKPQHKYHPTSLAPQMPLRMGESVVVGDLRDLFPPRGRQAQRHYQYGPGDGQLSIRNTESNRWQPLRSKYMTVEEIENIVRIQWAATHSSDPYVDDYYHQAMQTKLSRGSPHGRRNFAPSHLRDLPSHTRAAVEPHAYLQVDALGRVPFSSIRRPRPLLEVDSGLATGGPLIRGQGDGLVDGVPQYRPLEQEPMLAARIAIEEGLCLLLDVDDIDRLLTSSQPPDGGAQLRRRRQLLVEGLAASLQLAGTNADNAGEFGTHGGFTGLANKDDLLFLRLVSLPKGRNLLTRYLRLLNPGSKLVQIVAVTIFWHLRILFGGAQSDPTISSATVCLANATAVSVVSLDLSGLSACLAAVFLAPEQPPLRPMGSPAGDGATVVLRAVLERATSLLTDRITAYPLHNRAVWQASFDGFFALLTKYCTNKYDSIFHSLTMASSNNSGAVNATATAAAAMSKEMPVELLRASLPHTNDHQRSILLEFTQRSMSMGPFPPNTITEDHATSAPTRT